MNFVHYMFVGHPWYTGQFWPNMTQWVVVTLPVFLLFLWRLEHHMRQLHRHIDKVRNHK